MQEWFDFGAADEFVIFPAMMPKSLKDFTEKVVPVLQARGLFCTDYEGTMLRDHLGLTRPAHPKAV